jgi:DNA-binding ferritin-like protein (Dps family)
MYWGQKGVEGGMTRIDAVNLRDYDFVNTDRLVVQAIQELWRTGSLWFDYSGMMLNSGDRQPFYLGIPDTAYITVYGEILGDVVKRSYYDGEERAYSSYSAGYENMMKDAIRYVYRRGDRARATQMKNELAMFPLANMNDDRRAQWLAQDIDRFVRAELVDRMGSPSVALQEVVSSLYDAYLAGLVGGDMEVFERATEYAKQYHAAYLEQQLRENAQTGAGRMEFLDRRFDFVAGQVFGSLLPQLNVDLAQQAYYNAPPELRMWAYDGLVMNVKPLFDDEEGNAYVEGRSFDSVFPEPEGMDQFRAMLDREFGSRGRDLQRELK